MAPLNPFLINNTFGIWYLQTCFQCADKFLPPQKELSSFKSVQSGSLAIPSPTISIALQADHLHPEQPQTASFTSCASGSSQVTAAAAEVHRGPWHLNISEYVHSEAGVPQWSFCNIDSIS